MIFEGPSGRGKDFVLERALEANGFVNEKELKDKIRELVRKRTMQGRFGYIGKEGIQAADISYGSGGPLKAFPGR